MNIFLEWSVFKTKFVAKNMRWIDRENFYFIYANDSIGRFETTILKDDGADHVDFETNFKSTANDPANIPVDSDGSQIIRPKTTKTGWHYEPRSIDFVTSKYGSMYNRKHNGNTIDDGTDYGDATLTFWDGSGGQLSFQQTGFESETENDFQTRLTANCVKTCIDWQPTYDMDVIGGALRVKNVPVNRAYFWAIVAPDIPENMGGSVPFIAGGRALHMMPENGLISVDGRGIKTFLYDPVYNSNKFRVVIKHDVGLQIWLEIIFEHFRG